MYDSPEKREQAKKEAFKRYRDSLKGAEASLRYWKKRVEQLRKAQERKENE